MYAKNNKTIVITANTSWYVFNFRKNTIISLLKQGYNVTVLAPQDDYTDRLLTLGCEFKHIDIDKSGTNFIKDIKSIVQFYNFYRKNRVSAVLNFTPKNNIYSTIAANMNDIKSINNIAGLGAVFVKKNLLTCLVKKLYKFSQERATFVFFQNKEDKKIFDEANINISGFDILPGSGVDLTRFGLCEVADDGRVVFALVARLLIEKGIFEYAQAASNLKARYKDDVRFLLIGFTDASNPRSVTREQIEFWVNEGNIDYSGPVDDVESILKNVDCIVLPSYYREGVPKSLLEAAAMGKPIVTTDNVGCRDVVDDGITGYLCQSRSVADLSEKMEMIINLSHQERVNMGLRGREKIENQFDERIVIDKYLAIIEDVCN
ncbi:glycosyltransferase family 4 protein [Erwinia sp. AnSW2-5]|uniref:glycosyltransferase family 4 protein n=1 Tax=Erwinia sp. AnSW2-5 TaxID=3367692 RepID=UPI0038599FA6